MGPEAVVRSSEERSEYQRQYREKNAETLRAKKSVYYQENREQIRSQQKTYATEHSADIVQRVRAWRAAHPGQARATALANRLSVRFKMTPAELDSMWARQAGQCAMCARSLERRPGGFAVDHDHACCPGRDSCGACVRELLCRQCNVALGHVENEEWLQKAFLYIKKHKRARAEAA
jgi:hypothetical protein